MGGRVAPRLAIVCVAAVLCDAAPAPATLAELECAVAQFGCAYGCSKLSSFMCESVCDSLNVAYLCQNFTSGDASFDVLDSADLRQRVQRERDRNAAAREAVRAAILRPACPDDASALAPQVRDCVTTAVYVAVDGSDSNPGTLQQPFATPNRAAAFIRSLGPRAPGSTVVYLRAGTYYLGFNPLQLTEADSNVTWMAYPPDAPAPVVLSGAINLGKLNWTAYSGGVPGIMMAPVHVPDARRRAWRQSHPAAVGRAGPPPLVASLFVNGMRQVRARYPNGNPQDLSGLCFSATQRPGEGCPGWSSCAMGTNGMQPAPPGVAVTGFGPDRGNSTTLGCSQCHHCGTFGYNIYSPPSDHPVYNKPLPGIGWTNTSVFSFWGSPFDRPGSVVVRADSACDPHWGAVAYQHAEDAVVHMFHGNLWGGWMFAVDNVTHVNLTRLQQPTSAHQSAALPTGAILWLKADEISGVANGAPLPSWKDMSGFSNHASQGNASQQPVFVSQGIGGLPAVRFAGTQFLGNDNMALPETSTIFAVVRDNGTRTTYGSGIFFSMVGDNGLGTRAASNPGPNTADDDPAPIGADIVALMMDWSGSPANPGHRNLLHRPVVLSVMFEDVMTTAYVDGCVELQDQFQGTAGQGYMVGSRNNDMARFFIGDMSEVIVYPRALSGDERAAVNAYLQNKWSISPLKDCDQPVTETVVMNFGYGGYQEARGSSIGAGQHFYIENVLEELDVPGEWYYDESGVLYVLPNGTDITTAELAIPVTDSIVSVNGSQSGAGYATNIAFSGLTFTQSRVTFLEVYEVPSGGDWSVHRGGALFVQDAEDITISNCTFDQVGGNAIIFSNHVTHSSITDSEIVYAGDSGIIFLGSTDGIDGGAPTYPNENYVARNHVHEVGVYGKQTSCFGQQLAANTTFSDNVCYNGPRAGINLNDGFGGNNVIARNAVWNAVRETGDHGPLNSCWKCTSRGPGGRAYTFPACHTCRDRQPYWTFSHVDDGFNDPRGRSFLKAWDLIAQNFMLNGYNGVWTYDHDDCSQFFVDRSSFLVFGGCKNYIGDTKRCENNVILYPGTDGRSAGDRRCQTDDNGEFANSYYVGNTCTSADGGFYTFADCSVNPNNLNESVYRTYNNVHLADVGANFSQNCGASLTFQQWQALGQDVGSKTAVTPNVSVLIDMGAAAIGV